MKNILLAMFVLSFGQMALGHGMATGNIPDDMPDAQRIRFCERVRDQVLQAFYNRDRGRPMRLFEEDGSPGPRITNEIIRQIYAEPQISSPKKAETFGRARCNELMGIQEKAE